MRVALAALLVLLTLAGCVQPAAVQPASTTAAVSVASAASPVFADALGRAVDAAHAGLALAAGGEFQTGLAATEPTIGVTKDGAVFMTAERPNPTGQAQPYVPHVYLQQSPTTVMTTDKGQTWKDIFPKLPTGDGQRPTTSDPYVYVDSDTGRVFMDDIFPLSCGMMSFTDDKGASWTTDPYSCGNTQVNDHQTVVAAKPRMLPVSPLYPKLVYRCVNDLAASMCAVSLDGGLSFSPQVPVATQAQGCSALAGHLRADKDGRVYLPFECGGAPAYAVTENDGFAWTLVTIGPNMKTDSHDVSLALDDAGGIYAVFAYKDQVYYTASADHGKTWMPQRKANPDAVTGTQFDAIAVGSPGHVAIAYVGTTVPGGFDGKKDGECDTLTPTCTNGSGWDNATWNGYLTIATDALSPNATFETVQVNPANDPLARMFCGHSRCYGMNDFLDVVIDGEGRPWASFVDVCTQKCVTDPTLSHDKAMGFAGTLVSGPSLRGDGGTMLSVLPLQSAMQKPTS